MAGKVEAPFPGAGRNIGYAYAWAKVVTT